MRFTPAENGYCSIFLDFNHSELTEDYEYVCSYDSGKTFSTSVDGLEFSFQKMVAGNTVTIFNTGLDGRCGLKLIPWKGEGIMYKGHGLPFSALVNPKETQKRGDYVKLASLDGRRDEAGNKMWQVVESRGIWNKT